MPGLLDRTQGSVRELGARIFARPGDFGTDRAKLTMGKVIRERTSGP